MRSFFCGINEIIQTNKYNRIKGNVLFYSLAQLIKCLAYLLEPFQKCFPFQVNFSGSNMILFRSKILS